jgi:hypothetical protein
MVRKLILVATVALSVGGCWKTWGGSAETPSVPTAIGTISGDLINTYAPQIAAGVAASCGFIITAADVVGLSARIPSVAEAVRAICSKVNSLLRSSSRRRSGNEFVVYVNGAAVRGYFAS